MIERNYAKIRVAQNEATRSTCVVTLHNPARKNAIGPRMVNELLYAIADAHEDAAVRSIVITGEGNAFCAGGDFSQMTGDADAAELPAKGDYADLLSAMMKSQKPIVARVNGVAMGGGLGLVAAATFAIADETAVLATPEINVGLFPMMIMAVLTRVVHRRKLLEMMLLGDKMSAQDAVEIGLLNKAVTADSLDVAVWDLTEKISKKSPSTIALGLNAYSTQLDMSLAEALPLLRGELAKCLATDDAREGLMAFLEKRAPVWKGR